MSKELELANGVRNITKEWIEERMRLAEDEQKNTKTPVKTQRAEKEITAELQKHYDYYEKIIAKFKGK